VPEHVADVPIGNARAFFANLAGAVAERPHVAAERAHSFPLNASRKLARSAHSRTC
jgi:hypothetical protein